jgi:hypothetical protein
VYRCKLFSVIDSKMDFNAHFRVPIHDRLPSLQPLTVESCLEPTKNGILGSSYLESADHEQITTKSIGKDLPAEMTYSQSRGQTELTSEYLHETSTLKLPLFLLRV